MSNFKKLGCGINCPTPTGLIDCEGVPINVGDSVARCGDIPESTIVTVTNTIAGHRIATVTVNGVPTDIKETITSLESVTFDEATRMLYVTYKGEDGISVTKEENIPAIDAVIHIAPDVITPPTKYPQYYNTIVTDANGNFWGFSIDGTPTPLNFAETITTIFDVLTYANKHEIFKYQNESGLIKSAYETITALKSLAYDKITSTLTAVYTDESGTDVTKSAVIGTQATAFFNGTNPASATIFSLETPPNVNDNSLKQNPDYVLVGTDGSTWYWNGTAYVTAPVLSQTTEWYLTNTTVDAKGDKINKISRPGWIFVGANKTATCPLDLENTSPNTAFINVARYIAPNQNVAGSSTMFTMGAQQSVGNLADWRFYYAGNASANNRSDFGFTGNVSPNISMLYGGLNGVANATPLSRWDINGSLGFAIRGSGTNATQNTQDGTMVMTTAGTTYTLETPSGTTNARRIIAVKNISGGNITVVGRIDGVANKSITVPSMGGMIWHTNGSSWYQIADNTPSTQSSIGARVGRGVDVTLDNLKFRLSATGNPSLQVSTVAGTVTVRGTSSSNIEAYATATVSATTTPAYIRPALMLDQAGYIQRYLFTTSDAKSYEVRLVIDAGYASNLIHIERLA